jgi:hypothetical protein
MTRPHSHLSKKQSLTAAIHRYRGEWNLYLARCLDASEHGKNDDLPRTYEASMRALEAWTRPAESLDEAMMAMELAVADYQVGDTPRIPAMMNASLAWMAAEMKRRQVA